MRLLLDTHLIFWWLVESDRVPPQARALIESSSADVLVSRVSLWEMAIKSSIGKMHLDLSRFVRGVEEAGFVWLPIENHHLLQVATLPSFADHKDPFDRLLVAQSLTEPALLLTVDTKLARYGPTVRTFQIEI